MTTTQTKYLAEACRMAGIGQFLVFGLKYFADPVTSIVFVWSAVLALSTIYTGWKLLEGVHDE